MDFLDALGVLRRRWYVVLTGFVVLIGAALVTVFVVPTTYQASGQLVLLLPAQSKVKESPENPYLNLAPGLNVVGSLIASTLTTKESQRNLEAAGFKAEYSVALNPETGPILEVSAKDSDPALAIATRDEVIRRLDAELLRIQTEADVPARQFISARPNGVTSVAEVLPGSKIRALAAIAGLGVSLTLFIAFVIDRQRSKEPKRTEAAARGRPRDQSDEDEAETLVRVLSIPAGKSLELADDTSSFTKSTVEDEVIDEQDAGGQHDVVRLQGPEGNGALKLAQSVGKQLPDEQERASESAQMADWEWQQPHWTSRRV
jgi:capsular polysaccharide biosynthesis protein